jgi:chromosome partitioning protein
MLVTCASAKGGVGKTTSAVHIAAVLAKDNKTLLIDGDPNHSALKWAKRGNLPFQVVDLMAAPKHTRSIEHIVFDTPARPNSDDLEALVDGCDLLIIPTTPDILSIDATLETVNMLERLNCDCYRILLTIIPPAPRKTGEQAREALADLPLFKQSIRQFAAYEKAALEGVLVYQVKDRNARIAWREFELLGKEILQ